jgi:hypothetical protein
MSDFKVDKGVPLPKNIGRKLTKYPWHEMKVGDSFLVPTELALSLAANIAYRNRKFPEIKFVQRRVQGGYRVWRMK